jgi:toxin ParE1/3/4
MARLPPEFHPDARSEVLDAFEWYARRSSAVAATFQEELDATGRAIQKSPDRRADYLFGTRRYLMKRYPFVIVYRVSTDRIEIVAVAHGRRKPGYWRVRVEPK